MGGLEGFVVNTASFLNRKLSDNDLKLKNEMSFVKVNFIEIILVLWLGSNISYCYGMFMKDDSPRGEFSET